jgi:hypothetical protein
MINHNKNENKAVKDGTTPAGNKEATALPSRFELNLRMASLEADINAGRYQSPAIADRFAVLHDETMVTNLRTIGNELLERYKGEKPFELEAFEYQGEKSSESAKRDPILTLNINDQGDVQVNSTEILGSLEITFSLSNDRPIHYSYPDGDERMVSKVAPPNTILLEGASVGTLNSDFHRELVDGVQFELKTNELAPLSSDEKSQSDSRAMKMRDDTLALLAKQIEERKQKL